MAKKKLTLGMAAAAVAGTAVYVAKKSQDKKNQNGTSQNDIRDKANSGWSLTQHKINSGWTFNKKDDRNSAVNNSYRNTERGKYEKNSKGIYYTDQINYYAPLTYLFYIVLFRNQGKMLLHYYVYQYVNMDFHHLLYQYLKYALKNIQVLFSNNNLYSK